MGRLVAVLRMRRLILVTLFVAASLLFGAPGAAAAAQIEMGPVGVFTPGGEPLRIVRQGDDVEVRAQLNNTGDAAFQGVVSLVFHIRSENGVVNRDVTRPYNVTIPAGGSTNVTFDWTASEELVNHTVDVYQEDDEDNKSSHTFRVAEHAVLEGDLVDRFIQYGWFFGAFIVILVFFVAVVRLRKPRSGP